MSVSDIRSAKRVKRYRKKFAASGWDLTIDRKTLEEAGGELAGPVFYLIDLERGVFHLVASAEKDIIEKYREMMLKQKVDYQDVCDSLGTFYSEICTGKIKIDNEIRTMLLTAVAMYTGGTQSYQLSVSRNFNHPQFIVIVHHNHEFNCRILRPVPVDDPNLLEPDKLEGLVNAVIAQDMINHPKRFKSATVLPFKLKD